MKFSPPPSSHPTLNDSDSRRPLIYDDNTVSFSSFVDRKPLTPHLALERIKTAKHDSFSEKVDLENYTDIQQRLELWFLVEDALQSRNAFYSATYFIRKKSMITNEDTTLWPVVKKVVGPGLCSKKIHLVTVMEMVVVGEKCKCLNSDSRTLVEHCLGPRLYAVITMAQAALEKEVSPPSSVFLLLGFIVVSLLLFNRK